MKALVKFEKGVGNIEIRDVPVPEPDRDEALIKVMSVGICGTDLKIYDDQFAANVPVTIGHEFAGEIVKIGDDVKNWQIGDRIVSEQHTRACGHCRLCLTGRRHLCPEKKALGYGIDGAFAEYIKIPVSLLHKIPEGVSYDEAALVEPMAVAAYGIPERVGIKPEDYVVIMGCGPIAILALQMVLAEGAARVVMTGTDIDTKMRFQIAKEFGAGTLINVQQEDPVRKVMEETNGYGADVVVDLSGAPQAILQGLDMLAKDGNFCALGLPHGDVAVPWMKLALKAIHIHFSYSSNYISWERCLSMIRNGKVKLEKFTKDVYPLTDWEDAFARARSGEALKVIIKP